MSVTIKNNIKKILSKNKISVRDLERRAGLKSSTIQNILIGRSKNPTIKVLQSIAKELNTSIDNLINDSKVVEILPESIENSKSKLIKAIWNGKLFIDCSILVNRICTQKQINPTNDRALLCIIEIYNYSANSSNNDPDPKFAEWIIERFLIDNK